MAKGLVVRWNGAESAFGLTRVDREKLYGKKERVVVDEHDRPCASASLTADGRALIPSGGVSMLYVDDAGDTVERAELVHFTERGERAEIVPSTLGVPQELSAPVLPARLLDVIVTHVYALSRETVGAELAQALAAGSIFETRFNYRDDFADAPLFLLENDQGLFALVAAETGFVHATRELAPSPDAEDEAELGEDLDFGML